MWATLGMFIGKATGRLFDWLLDYFKPSLDLEVHCSPPDCQKTPLYFMGGTRRGEGYQYRIKIINNNPNEAKGVKVIVCKLERKQNNEYMQEQ